MKKIIVTSVMILTLITSTFAFSFSVGAKGTVGKNFGVNDDIVQELENINQNTSFDFGGGAYVDLSFLPFFGIMAEANLIGSSISFVNNSAQTEKYTQLLLDLTPMLWSQYDFWIFQLGFGVGPNFSCKLAEIGDVTSLTTDSFTVGVAAGADFKIFFGKHVGLVIGGRFIAEFDTTDVPVTVGSIDSGETYPSVSFPRRTLYGNVGLEFKL